MHDPGRLKDPMGRSDPIRRWYASLKSAGKCRPGSTTWQIYQRWLDDFLTFAGISPEKLLKLAEKKKIKPLLDDYVSELEKRGLGKNTRAQAVAAIKSFLIHNDVYVWFQAPTEMPMQKPPVPPEAIRALLQALDRSPTEMNRAAIAFILVAKDSGLSTSTILSLTWDGGEPHHIPIKRQLEFGLEPVHVRVRRAKTGVVHDSFIGPEGMAGLRLLQRIWQEPLSELKGPLFPFDGKAIYQIMYTHSKRLGMRITPKDLRKFFITRMKMARVPNYHPAAWDVMVEYMAEHSTGLGRVQRAYFLFEPEKLKEYYMASYDAIRVGYPFQQTC